MKNNADVEKITKEIRDRRVLELLRANIKDARKSKAQVNERIRKSIDEYHGKKYGNEVQGKSQIVKKTIFKAIENMKPNIITPFVGNANIINVEPDDFESVESSIRQEAVLRKQWGKIDRLELIETIADVLPKEGTVWLRTGWEYIKTKYSTRSFNISTQEQLAEIEKDKDISIREIEDLGNGEMRVTADISKIEADNPTVEVVPNEDILCDPTASNKKSIKWVIRKYKTTISNMKKEIHRYEPEAVKRLETLLEIKEMNSDSLYANEIGRSENSEETGKDYQFTDNVKTNREVELYEYWGEYDIHNTGINKQVVIIFHKSEDVVLKMEENPFPNKKIPFIVEQFIKNPFSVWGYSLSYAISENQKIDTAITRGIIDNLAQANNAQKFVKQNSLDPINRRRMLQGFPLIEYTDELPVDGSYNEIPQSVFNFQASILQDADELSGVPKQSYGIDQSTFGRTASGLQTVLTTAQKRMTVTSMKIANALEQVFNNWLDYNTLFLPDDYPILRGLKFETVNRYDLVGNHSTKVKITSEIEAQTKIQQLNMMLQQAQALKDTVPPEIIKSTVAKIYELQGEYSEATMIMEYEPQPDPAMQEMAQLELEEKRADIALKNSQAQMNTYKTKETQSKTDKLDMETVMKPAELEEKITRMNQPPRTDRESRS